MSLKKFKSSKYVTFHDLQPGGVPVTVTAARTEKLENFRTQELEDFLVLEFAEVKPLVCKNPVLDALAEAFPEVDEPNELVGRRIQLIQSVERIAGDTHELVRVDPMATARLQAAAPPAPTPPTVSNDETERQFEEGVEPPF